MLSSYINRKLSQRAETIQSYRFESIKQKVIAALFTVIMVLWIFYPNHQTIFYISYLFSISAFKTILVIVVTWCLSLIAIITIFTLRLRYRVIWAFVISFSSAFSYGFYLLTKKKIVPYDIISVLSAPREIQSGIKYYVQLVPESYFMLVLGLLLFTLVPSSVSKRLSIFKFKYSVFTPILPMLFILLIIALKPIQVAAGLPFQFNSIPITTIATIDYLNYEFRERESVVEFPVNPQLKNLILAVDESIRGDYVEHSTINESLNKLGLSSDNPVINFGVASSGSNNSANSNVILRYVANKQFITQSLQRNPSIWQLAKNAGYKTYYIDGQFRSSNFHVGKFQNYMTYTESYYIDNIERFDGEEYENIQNYEIDSAIVELVQEIMLSEQPVFIYVNKFGAHFPYNNSYPIENSESHESKHDALQLKNDKYDDTVSTATQSSYKKAVNWSVNSFFEKLLAKESFEDTLVIYTSDHGQNLTPGAVTHGSQNPHPDEGVVPMIAITSNANVAAKLKDSAKNGFDRYTHFEIVPTLLKTMGYNQEWVTEKFGNSLFNSAPNTQEFSSGDIMGFQHGSSIRWTPIDVIN